MAVLTSPPVPHPVALTAGQLVDARFALEAPLGAGAQADVWRARDIHLERPVALKVLRSPAVRGLNGVGRFKREAALLARLRSPHLATIYSFGFLERAPYFAMELIEGRSLHELAGVFLDARHPIPVGRTVDVIGAAARGLAVAHAEGIVHRDVKPENVMVENDTGRVLLVDFGVASHRGEGDDGFVYGTMEYLAPEVLSGARASAASDQYGLAMIAYELLTGRLPFPELAGLAQVQRRAREDVPRPSAFRADLVALDEVLLRALSRSPEARYPTSIAFGNALGAAAGPTADDVAGAVEGGLRVLVVDDDPLFVKLVTRCLQVAFAGVPLSIARATDPLHALSLCGRRLPDLVILDYMMPELDGVELLTRIRALPDGANVRTVVLSATADRLVQLRFGMLGVRTFAGKPIDFEALVATLAEVGRANGWIAPRNAPA